MKFQIGKEWCEAKAKEQARDLWLERCAKVLREKGGLEPAVALGVAASQLENIGGDLTESPEQAAEDEMSYWTAD